MLSFTMFMIKREKKDENLSLFLTDKTKYGIIFLA